MTALIWLCKLILAHLLTDFILQPKSWIAHRNRKHFSSGYLYLHGAVTALTTYLLIGWEYWLTALVILISHILIDGWKSYRERSFIYFFIDQLLHILVILACWYFTFFGWNDIKFAAAGLNNNPDFWILLAAYVFQTVPAGIIIGEATKKWREKIDNAESLANAGKWIGMIERLIILTLVVLDQYETIGLLIATKGIIRFNEKDRPEIKTEYLVIGTLLSISMCIFIGLVIKKFFLISF
ncbi:MAG TPA: DUF3307 domain-containing protein [Flavitalea sp.]|nr:DUF3307 domain-containing protein [Flavitalea sp.]